MRFVHPQIRERMIDPVCWRQIFEKPHARWNGGHSRRRLAPGGAQGVPWCRR